MIDTGWFCNIEGRTGETIGSKLVVEHIDRNKVWEVGDYNEWKPRKKFNSRFETLSMFPWHIDAHYLYSTNYHYCGSAGIATTNSTNWVANCRNVKADDGRFMAEPGFVVVGCFAKKKVYVGSLEWVKRPGVTKNPFLETKELVMKVGIDGVLAGLRYVEDERNEDVTGVQTLTSQGINVYLFYKDQTGSVEYVASILGIPKKPMFYVVKEAVSLTDSGESIRTNWITYISTDSMLISLLCMMICWSR
ncbi:putative translocase [Helianthus annuus]|nr:putative translocase [Helianthus annuus]